MDPRNAVNGHKGITQENFLALMAKTDMRKIAERVDAVGVKAWREFVYKNASKLMKSSTSTGITTGLGLNFVDLRSPAYMLDPIYSHLRNSTPRWDKTNAGYGVQPTWKAVTSIDVGAQFPGVSEGNTNSNGQFTSQNFSAPYVTLGTNDFLTYESISAAEGYEDVEGDAHMWQLLRFIRQSERTMLGGAGTTASNGALQLGTTSTPTAALTSVSNTSNNPTYLPTGSYAAAYAVALSYRAVTNPSNTVAAGLTTQYLRSNQDGSSDVINGGTAIVSAASNVAGPTVSGTKNVLFYCTPQAGAWGYAWFIQTASATFTPSPASALLAAITVGVSAYVYTGIARGTQTAAYSGSNGYAGFSTDCSTNLLDYDGLLTIASNANYMTGLPTFSYPTGTGYTVLQNGVDMHGAGLTNGGMPGSIAQIDNMLYAIQQATLTGPTTIYLSTDQVGPFRTAMLVGATTGAASIYFFPNGGPPEDGSGLSINTLVARYHNVYGLPGGGYINVVQHPYLPTGTILFDTARLQEPYNNSRLAETRGVFVRRDTYGIEFAQTSRKYPFGVYSEEVLAVKTPNLIGYIRGLGAYGATNLF